MKFIVILIIVTLFCMCVSCSKQSTEPEDIIPAADTVATPVLTLGSGTYTGTQMVGISCSTPYAVIRYTLDNSMPDSTSAQCIFPIPIDSTLTLKVRAFKTDWIPSQLVTAEYVITHEPEYVHSIEFVQSGQIDLNVANSGGINSAVLRAKLYKENGELYTASQDVWFKINNPYPPAGANLNNQSGADSVLVVANNGMADVTVYSGNASGIMNVKASTTSGGQYLTDHSGQIVIHSAPPHRIEVFSSGFNSGFNLGGGLWKIIVGARLYDIYDNPVSYGTSVWFNLPNNIYNCQIGANAYVGNESATGDSTAGVAYTYLIYSGIHSQEAITIRVLTGGLNGAEVFEQELIILPVNQPQLELEVIPGNLVFHGNTNTIPQSANATIHAAVFDIQGCPIHKAWISLTSNYGTFEPIHGTNEDPQNCNPHANPNLIVTDWYDQNARYEWYYDPFYQIPGGVDNNDGQDGLAQGSIRIDAADTPYDDPMDNCSTIRVVTIIGNLVGTDISSTVRLNLIKSAS